MGQLVAVQVSASPTLAVLGVTAMVSMTTLLEPTVTITMRLSTQEMLILTGYQMNWILTMITGIVTEMEFPKLLAITLQM